MPTNQTSSDQTCSDTSSLLILVLSLGVIAFEAAWAAGLGVLMTFTRPPIHAGIDSFDLLTNSRIGSNRLLWDISSINTCATNKQKSTKTNTNP